jgi:hypothetical protein
MWLQMHVVRYCLFVCGLLDYDGHVTMETELWRWFDMFCEIEVTQSFVPLNRQFNVGDSIGEGEAAEGTIGSANHQTVWSTGYAGGDSVNAMNERFEATDPVAYTENNSTRDGAFNPGYQWFCHG